MKMKSHFNFIFAFNERSLQRLSEKNTHTSYSLPLRPIDFCVCLEQAVRYKSYFIILCQDCHK